VGAEPGGRAAVTDRTATAQGNVADLLAASARERPDRPALIDADRSISYGELDATVDRVAGHLAARVPGTGRRIALLLPNSIEFVIAFFAVLRAGHVAVPLSPSYTAAELIHQVGDCTPALLVTDAGHEGLAAAAAAAAHGCAVLTVPAGWAGAAAGATPAAERPGGGDLALILYTSGTSGRPKGAMLSHGALLANQEQLEAVDPPIVRPDDVTLLVLPLFHVYGLNTGLCLALRAGATVVLVPDFDPVATLRLVREHAVTSLVGAPPMYVAWSMLPDVADALGSLRLAVSGAAPLPATVQAKLLDAAGLQVHEGYGLTETAPVLTTTLCSPTPKPGSIGRPIPGVELHLLDEAGEEVDEDDPGEIAVRGANLFAGYWPDGADGPGADGWWRTGDIAYADSDGDLFIVGRTRELILVSGFNVYPREVEQAIASHPAVAEVAVIGVPHPYTGETVKALIVPDGTAPTAGEIIDHAAARLARFKCPTTVEIVAELPHSLSGKVAKGRLGDPEAT
jgi:long-chain acyl-CoA synthetase